MTLLWHYIWEYSESSDGSFAVHRRGSEPQNTVRPFGIILQETSEAINLRNTPAWWFRVRTIVFVVLRCVTSFWCQNFFGHKFELYGIFLMWPFDHRLDIRSDFRLVFLDVCFMLSHQQLPKTLWGVTTSKPFPEQSRCLSMYQKLGYRNPSERPLYIEFTRKNRQSEGKPGLQLYEVNSRLPRKFWSKLLIVPPNEPAAVAHWFICSNNFTSPTARLRHELLIHDEAVILL